MRKRRVLIVDDSPLMRELLTAIIGKSEDLEVAGTASDPLRAVEMLDRVRPDVMTLDVEMPRQDGLSFLEELMRDRPMPVVMISSLTARGSELALRALELGAVDVVEKPKIDIMTGTFKMAGEILDRLRAAAVARVRPRPALLPGASPPRPVAKGPPTFRTTDTVIAVGASTGGTEALAELFRALPADSPGVLVVQHMPARFTGPFAKRLDGLSKVRVTEASDGMPVMMGHAMVAPGGRQLRLVRSGGKYLARVTADPPVNLHQPSVDVLFESCATAAGSAAVGVILTGMGADGALGMLAMRQAGAPTIAQDEASCVVFGMPKEAIARGGVQQVLPLNRIASAVAAAVRRTA